MNAQILADSTSYVARPVPIRKGVSQRQQCRTVAARFPCKPVQRRVSCMAASLDKQDDQLRAAEKRWENQVREGRVKNVSAADAANLVKEGWYLLDVRPPNETDKVSVKGAVQVPLFVADQDNSFGGMMKKATAFGMGGWWLGGTHTVPNSSFLAEVQQKVPKDVGVVVACQKGLRSLAACEQLYRSGYNKVAWINGGFDTARAGDLETVDGRDLRYAGIGGLSELLGWTEVQQQDKEKEGVPLLVKLAAIILAADLLLFAVEQFNYLKSQGQL